jgi:hypothetical protein
MEKDPVGNHHPYCKATYHHAHYEHIDWRCTCDLLRKYDKWRKLKRHSNAVFRDSERYLKQLED